jgi:hypothetical protein
MNLVFLFANGKRDSDRIKSPKDGAVVLRAPFVAKLAVEYQSVSFSTSNRNRRDVRFAAV